MVTNICYVVNAVSETSVPATIGTAITDHTNFSVDILAWFDAKSFEGDDRVGLTCLNARRNKFGIDSSTYRRAHNELERYDLIQAHHNHSGSFAKLLGYGLGIPLVSREGNTRNGFTRKGRIANGLTNGLADRIVPNSRAVYESFTRWERALIDEEDVEIIPNGVDLVRIEDARASDYDLRDRLDIPEGALVVGTAAILTEQKAIDVLIKGLGSANERSEQRLDLVIAGDGPARAELEALSDRLGVREQVHFLGMVDRFTVYQLLTRIDIYAMPSRWEGFASAAVEALGAGNPCVFSDIDPFLLPYKNVSLFHRVDDADDLASRLAELAEDSNLRDQYGKRGRQLVEENYTLEAVAGEYADLYANVLEEKRTSN
ncbi:glycosyltransferase [Halobacteriales archaeon SW_7_65_23]|nr:MAG: glycosyltransferase [Halobacteriales archaeon SW_7_65_23]